MNELQSLGHASGVYQRHPREIDAAVCVIQAEAAIALGEPIPHESQPAMRLNGVAYFKAEQIAAAIGWLAQNDAKKATRAARDE